MSEEKSIFETLNAVDVSDRIREKGGLRYLSWAAAWAEVKEIYPDATYQVIKQTMPDGNLRFWHDDGRSGWVEVEVTINDLTHAETLAIMDFKNKAMAADAITSVDANKSLKRCLTKACALHGLGLYIYLQEDLPEDVAKANELRDEIAELAKKKAALSDTAKAKVAEFCKAAEKDAFPGLDDSAITGNYKFIEDVDVLEKLKKQLMAVRK